MARQAQLVWRGQEALASFEQFVEAASAHSTIDARGLFRPATDSRQQKFMQNAAKRHPGLADYISPELAKRKYELLNAPHGGLWISRAKGVCIPDFCRCLAVLAEKRGATIFENHELVGYTHHNGGVRVTVRDNGAEDRIQLTANNVLLCTGSAIVKGETGGQLNLHMIKGESIVVSVPIEIQLIPHLSGSGYAVFHGDSATLGSTYDHEFTDDRPSVVNANKILSKIARMVPNAIDFRVLDHNAGIRVTVPGTYKPMVGPLPGQPNVWILTGLGSKGLLMSALISNELHRFFRNPKEIPEDIRVH